jgi:hypothetical protein
LAVFGSGPVNNARIRRSPPWDPLREDEHDEDEDHAIGGHREIGSDGTGQAVAGGHVCEEFWRRRC